MRARRVVSAVLVIATSAMAAETAPATKPVEDPAELKKIAAKWIEKALPLADKIQDDEDRDYLLGQVADGYFRLGKLDDAAKIIKRTKTEHIRDYFDAAYVVEVNKQNPEAAIKATAELNDRAKWYGVILLCRHFLDANDVPNALKAAEIAPNQMMKDLQLREIVRHLVKLDHLQEAAELREKIKEEEVKTECTRDIDLRRLVFQKRGDGRKEFIRQTAVEMGYKNDELDQALRRRGDVLVAEGNIKEARELAELMEDADSKVGLLFEIARELYEKGDKEQHAIVLAEANGLRPKMADLVAIFLPAWMYNSRIEAGDAAAVIREIEMMEEKNRPDYEGAYIRALLKMGTTKTAAERILKLGRNPLELAQDAEMLGKDGRVDDAEYLAEELSDPEIQGHIRAGFGVGLIQRAQKIEAAQNRKK